MEKNMRETLEYIEDMTLSEFATKSKSSNIRKVPEENDNLRTCFQRDADRILHCNSFQREKDKTQVIIGAFVENGDHYRTRMTHSLEVSRVAKTVARALRLNEDLAEAAALGHDLGHTPFGHTGEYALNKIFSFGFNHTLHSIRIAETLEKKGKGLNLCEATLDAIKNHSGLTNAPNANTIEGKIIPFADKIAYLTSDYEDAIHFGVIKRSDLPKNLVEHFGQGKTHAMGYLINGLIVGSIRKNTISMDELSYQFMSEFRKWMFANVYKSEPMNKQREKATLIIESLCSYYFKNPHKIIGIERTDNIERDICDFVAGMTDNYAINTYKDIFTRL